MSAYRANISSTMYRNSPKRRPEDLLASTSKRHNRFAPLAIEYQQENKDQGNLQPLTTPKPPPIVIATKHKFNDCQEILSKQNCFFKKTSTGTKVFCDNQSLYAESIKLLTAKQIEFHTYKSKSDRLLTVYLHGLSKAQKSDIEEEFRKMKLEFESITELQTNSQDPNNGLYKVQFKRSVISFGQLKQVNKINRTLVTWKPHKPRVSNGPMQCWRCLMFGHGGENCNRATACMICASLEHLSKDCPTRSIENPTVSFKCFNCIAKGFSNVNHRANDPSCESRMHYLEIRKNALNKNNRRQPSRKDEFNLDKFQFPAMPSANNNNFVFRKNPLLERLAPSPVPSYADQVRASPVPSTNQGLFSTDELFDIFFNAYQDLQKCQSRAEQIKVIASLLKHAI
jgi:hypothetical protein